MQEQLISVAGGNLTTFTSGPRTGARGTVLLIHGITASADFMAPVAEALASDLFTINVDLRGRGGSAGLPGPSGMQAHVEDMAAALRHFDVENCVVIGHSMGAYVATMFAKRHPRPAAGLVLIDGGFPTAIPPGTPPQVVLDRLVGPALTRFTMEFGSTEEYVDFYKGHPALSGDQWNHHVEDYVLGSIGSDLRPIGNVELIRADGADNLLNEEVRNALFDLALPVELIRAGKGFVNDPGGFIPLEVAESAAAELPDLRLTTLESLNHYTIVFNQEGAQAAATATERLLNRPN
jgi:lipase